MHTSAVAPAREAAFNRLGNLGVDLMHRSARVERAAAVLREHLFGPRPQTGDIAKEGPRTGFVESHGLELERALASLGRAHEDLEALAREMGIPSDAPAPEAAPDRSWTR